MSKLNRYRVSYGYRTDDGLDYSISTSWDNVEVEAENEQAARIAAIDAAYKQNPGISHVLTSFVYKHRN